MNSSRPTNLEEFKIQASILLKNLRSNDTDKTARAAVRFQLLPQLSNLSLPEIVAKNESVKLKHALTVIAIENNHKSWADLKHRFEKINIIKSNREYTSLYPERCEGFFNEWYVDYEIARRHREEAGGYLLPYKNQFFICQRDYIKYLGLDPDDADWTQIGWDWVEPADHEAWQRLSLKLRKVELHLTD